MSPSVQEDDSYAKPLAPELAAASRKKGLFFGKILWQPSTFNHELLCEVSLIVDTSRPDDLSNYRFYIKLKKETIW